MIPPRPRAHALVALCATASVLSLALAACSDDPPPVSPIDLEGAGGSGGGAPRVCTPGTIEACYEGPEGTLDVGLCKAGSRTCLPSGLAFTVCKGAVLPRPENCTTPEDEACDGESDACSAFGAHWAKSFGLSGSTIIKDVAVDKASGDLIVVGNFTGSVSFGVGTTMQSKGGNDIFVARLDALGEPLWAKPLGNADEQTASSVVVDSAGRIFVGGEAKGSFDFGLGTLPTQGGADALLLALDANGSTLWGKLYGAAKDQRISALALTNAGNVAIAGEFQGTFGIGGPALFSQNDSIDAFIGIVDPAGVHLMSRRIGGADVDLALDLAVDSDDALILVGSYAGLLSIGAPALNAFSKGARDAYIAKLRADGKPIWLKSYGGFNNERIFAVTTSANDIFLAGDAESPIAIANNTLTPANGARGLFLASLDKDGGERFSLMHSSPKTFFFGASLAIDPTTLDLLVGGYFEDTLDLGNGPSAAAGGTDVVIARLSGQGSYISSRTYGGPLHEGAYALAVTPAGLPILAGAHRGSVDFGQGVLPAPMPNESNAFLATLWP